MVFNYHLPEAIQSLKEQRRESEIERAKEGDDKPYPSWDRLRQEDREEAPSIVLTVRDGGGKVIRRINGPSDKGFHRVAWDMRYPAPDPVNLDPQLEFPPWMGPPKGPLAMPGEYSVILSKRVQGELVEISPARTFALMPLFEGGLVTNDRQALIDFQMESYALYRAVTGADKAADEIQGRIDHLMKAVADTNASSEEQARALRALNARMQDFQAALKGDSTVSDRAEKVPMSINDRISFILYGHWDSQSAVTDNYRDSYAIAEREFRAALADLKGIAADLTGLEAALQEVGAPWTPGRIPDWP